MIKNLEDAIREAAYYNWQNAGCPQGQDEYFWSMAVEQLNKNCNKNCCKSSSVKKSSVAVAKKSSSSKTASKSSAKKSSK